MKDQMFREIALSDAEVGVVLLAHFGMPKGEVRRANSGALILRAEVMPNDTTNPGWIDWTGGDCPVPSLSNVEVRFDTCDTETGPARGFRWYRWSHPSARNIVAYRVI